MNEDHPDTDANNEGDDDNEGNLNSPFGAGIRARLFRNWVEFFSGIGFYAFGDDCTNWGFIYWGFFFHYLCIVIGALIGTEHALALWPKWKIRVWVAYIGLCVILAFFYVKSSWPKSIPEPHLEVGFSIGGAKGFPLLLTNDIFNVPFNSDSGEDFIKFIDMKGFVKVPVPPGTSNAVVEFVLENPSLNDVLDVSVKLAVPNNTNFPFVLDSSWVEDRVEDIPGENCFLFTLQKVPFSRVESLPSIIVGTRGPQAMPISFRIIARDMKPIVLALRLVFLETQFPEKPSIAISKTETNKDGTVIFKLTAPGRPQWH